MELVNRNWWKKCRVCNKEGSKYIFDRIPTSTASTSLQTVSSTEKLLEKLRFVTMIKIDEFDNKPKMLCDLCIIQLNVSYQFKTLAMEMDTKHQQYIIENGINHSPNSDTSTLQYIEHSTFERSSTTLRPLALPANFSSFHQRRLIKSEPTDYEIMSDITIDTNTDRVDDVQMNVDNNNAYNQRFDGGVKMVCVNDLDLLRSNGDSDIEFINNCLPAMSYRQYEKPPNTLTTTTHQTKTTTTIGSQLVIAASKPTNKISNFSSSNHRHGDTRQASNSVEQLSESVSNNSSSNSNSPPKSKQKQKHKKNLPSNEYKKTLRPKTSENINYSLVKRHKNRSKVINPMNKMRQMIKEENESSRRPSTVNSSQELSSSVDHRLVKKPKNRSLLVDKRKKGQRKIIRFATGQKGNQREIRNILDKRRITIRDTDRFKFASISSIKNVKTTGN